MELTHEYTHDIGHRFKSLILIMIVVFLAIAAKLYYLQIIKGPYYQFFAEQNSIKEITIPALRGGIFDRNGKSIVDNRPAFDVIVIPQYIHDHKKVITSLSDILNLKEENIEVTLQKFKEMPKYFPIVVKSDVSQEEVSVVRTYKTPWHDDTDKFDLRGVDIRMRYARVYADDLAESHLLGYLREIDANKLKAYADKGINSYKMGDFIGIGGVEEMWDDKLRGEDGFDQRVVNAIGREVIWPEMELIHENPKNGANLKLTIDVSLQNIAKQEFSVNGKNGAVVAIDPRNGDVLAFYSSPSINLNKLSSSAGGKYWQEIVVDKEKPLYNRVIQGTYPPASTFKITTAATALATGELKPNDKLFCGGGLHYGGRLYQCWRKGGHGSIDIKTALTSSCDTFFYQLGLKLGVDKIAKYANLLGLGHTTKIDLPGEKSGTIPTSEWKEKRTGQPWQAGENLSIAVGQGYDAVTPLQNAVMIGTIANGGHKITPHVADSVIDAGGNEIYKWHNTEENDEVISSGVVSIIKQGLQGVVGDPLGTGYRLKSLGLKIAGKTGTAQVIGKESWKSGVEKLKDHAWFVGYAPYDNPKIAVAVIVENGGFGASAAAPIVGKIMQEYLK